jgi:hypothetical protein
MDLVALNILGKSGHFKSTAADRREFESGAFPQQTAAAALV